MLLYKHKYKFVGIATNLSLLIRFLHPCLDYDCRVHRLVCLEHDLSLCGVFSIAYIPVH